MTENYPLLPSRGEEMDNEKLLRLAWLIGGTAAEEWLQGHRYEYRPNPAVREALEINVELDKSNARRLT